LLICVVGVGVHPCLQDDTHVTGNGLSSRLKATSIE
jgi:hypothetical protein